MISFLNKTRTLKKLAKSVRKIEKSYLDKDEARYKALYDYGIKQYELEIARTRALETKTTSFLTAMSILVTAYSSVCLLHIKSGFNPDLLLAYAPLVVGSMGLAFAIFFWIQANSVKKFDAANIDQVKTTIKDKCKTPEAVYNQLFTNVIETTKSRRKTNLAFGKQVDHLSKSVSLSMVCLLLTVAATSIEWYSDGLDSDSKPETKIGIYILNNYIEPEDLPADDAEVALEGIDPPVDIPAPDDSE
ncbi:hypothetical protein [Vibrio aestuarianus]|uniref:hypothetical protein n=1 Tax=Vibrio aestuarianus TaxID=28171 RepID=UPI00237CEE79|nr:hypothetical protein [Vibrio aestuarianus]MDE1341240.1 hypothetical protein [Vibrio aestuarianus]CAH8242272.1 hypothetical protein VAE122_3700001 [Vibrio aestuarianus]